MKIAICQTKPGKAKEIGELAVECIERTGKHFQLRVPLTGEYKIGNNWSETH